MITQSFSNDVCFCYDLVLGSRLRELSLIYSSCIPGFYYRLVDENDGVNGDNVHLQTDTTSFYLPIPTFQCIILFYLVHNQEIDLWSALPTFKLLVNARQFFQYQKKCFLLHFSTMIATLHPDNHSNLKRLTDPVTFAQSSIQNQSTRRPTAKSLIEHPPAPPLPSLPSMPFNASSAAITKYREWF